MNRPLIAMKHAITESQGWLRSALDYATEDPDAVAAWPALRETSSQIEACLNQIDKLLPLHSEIEAGVKEEWEDMADYE